MGAARGGNRKRRAGAFDFKGQTVQVGASLENAPDGVIRDSGGHAMVAERAGDSGGTHGRQLVWYVANVSPPCILLICGNAQGTGVPGTVST